jgi:hypothetical protein
MSEKLPDKLSMVGHVGDFFIGEGIEIEMNDIAKEYNSLEVGNTKRKSLYESWKEKDSYRKDGIAD